MQSEMQRALARRADALLVERGKHRVRTPRAHGQPRPCTAEVEGIGTGDRALDLGTGEGEVLRVRTLSEPSYTVLQAYSGTTPPPQVIIAGTPAGLTGTD